MAKTTKTAPRAKAEARPAEAATKKIEAGMETLAGFASKFSEYTEDGVKALKDNAALSTETMREIGSRNMNFMTQAMEQGVELTQALASARDPRELFELQSGFAKSMFTAYTTEMKAQTELCLGAWREAAKPFMSRFAM
ncbi:phasin [Hyphomonas sp. WL0036]|uniref:phasin n=1 Tax=Hyphomonas sediminis TaxID=2866160 RepID=UPI001C80B650|nr:phasin [Hyphomonas sediminis]MBY9067016.1 phasin [Hyphomonas sediminis]